MCPVSVHIHSVRDRETEAAWAWNEANTVSKSAWSAGHRSQRCCKSDEKFTGRRAPSSTRVGAVASQSEAVWTQPRGCRKKLREAQEVCYVMICAVEGMDTNSRRMFLAISTLFCAIIRAFWMSWCEYP